MSCKKKKCGCEDEPVTTADNLCNTVDCAETPACEQYTDAPCTILAGYGILDLHTDANASLTEMIQRLTILTTNPSCMSGGTCSSTPLVYPTTITTTTIAIWWKDIPVSTAYEVNYKAASSGVWIPLASQTTNTATITGLITATDYHVKVVTGCAVGGPCDSVTLTITTK
jgi:hypothetical protein